MIKCSVCILTYNSEKTLEVCLQSVKDFSDILILDGGSRDGTLEIAKKFSARVLPQENNDASSKINDFTAIRQRSFELAEEDWIFWLDSDEWLNKEARDEIKKITQSENENDKNKLYYFLRKIVFNNNRVIKYSFHYPEYCGRLFNKNSGVVLKSKKKVHESLIAPNDKFIEMEKGIAYHFWWEDYKNLIKKDKYYLKLTINKAHNLPLKKCFRKILINFAKGTHIGLKSFKIYLKYGFKESLPPKYVWRFMRYHFLISLGLIKRKINNN